MDRSGWWRVALGAALVVAVVAVAVVLFAGGDDDTSAPPPVAAARLVPADALVFADLDSEPGRPATSRAVALAGGFPGYPALRDQLLAADVRAWAGGEAALAFLPAAGGSKVTGSLVLVRVRDRAGASRYVAQHASGALVAATAGDFVAIGPPEAVRAAVALAGGAGGGRALADDPAYRRAVAPLPAGRVLTAYATTVGVRRLLAPASGVLGVLGGLLDRPGLRGVGVAFGPAAAGAGGTAHWLLDPAEARKIQTFTPTLLGGVPSSAIVVIATRGLPGALSRLLGLTSGQTGDGGLGPLLGTAAQSLAKRSSGSVRAGVLGLLDREAVAYVVPTTPRPTLTILARTSGQLGAEAALAALRPSVARVLAQPNAAGTRRVAARWRSQALGGVTVWRLPFASGSELDYAVVGGRLIVSTSLAGLRTALRPGAPITGTDSWKAVVGNHGKPIGSLVFLDFNQLLRLGEQTGLADSRAYQRVRDDLQRIQAVGSTAIPGAGESTAELLLQIP